MESKLGRMPRPRLNTRYFLLMIELGANTWANKTHLELDSRNCFLVENLNHESFLDSPTCIVDSPRGRIGKASNAINIRTCLELCTNNKRLASPLSHDPYSPKFDGEQNPY